MSQDRIAIFETTTGKILSWPTAVSAYSWSTGVNDTEGSLTVETNSLYVDEWQTTPWLRSLAIIDKYGVVQAAGPIYKRNVDLATGVVTLTAGSFWSLVKKRIFQREGRPVLADNTHYQIKTDGSRTDWRQTFRGTLGGIAVDVLRSQFSDIPGVANFQRTQGGNQERTYDGIELQTVADLVSNLFQTQTPPMMRFGARLDGMYVSYTCGVLGETVDPMTFAVSLDANAGVAFEAKVNEDAGGLVNQSWFVSRLDSQQASQESMFAQATRALKAGEPRLSSADSSHDKVSNGSTLDSYAAAVANSEPFHSFTLSIARGVTAGDLATSEVAEQVKTGDWVVLTTERSFWGPSTFAGRASTVAGDHEKLEVSVERVTRYDGINAPVDKTRDVLQIKQGDALNQIMNFAAFTRRANNTLI